MEKEIKLAPRYAHRGYYINPDIPENSMAAFRRAVDHGLGSELDVQLLADGSLVIFHDDELGRMTGVKGWIVDYDMSNLRKLRLGGTDEPIPAFDEVLDLYENSGLRLMVEIKPSYGNYRPLTEAVIRRLDSYKGEFAVESFDPRAMMIVRKMRPEWTRGQLVQDFYKTPDGVPPYQMVLLTNLAFNRFVQPDFVAYRFQDRKWLAWRRWLAKKGVFPVTWTIKSAEEYRKATASGNIPIFEQITPEELKELVREGDI